MGKRARDVRDDGAHESIGFGFGLGVCGVPFADIREGVRKGAELRVFAHNVPGAFQDEGADTREDRKGLWGGILACVAELADHWGFFAVPALDGENAGFWEETAHAAEYFVQSSV